MPDLSGLLAGIGGAVGSSLLGNALSGGAQSTGPQNQVINSNLQAQRLGLQTGQGLLGLGANAIGGPLNYYSSILSGNKGLMTSALAPEISQIGQGYQQAQQTSSALNPRGGTSVQFNSQLPYMQQRDVSSLMQGARPQAAQALGGLGSGLLGQGANALYASTAAGQGILNQQQAAQALAAQRGQGIGSGLFSIFQQYGQGPLQQALGKIFGGGPDTPAPSVGPIQGPGFPGGGGVISGLFG